MLAKYIFFIANLFLIQSAYSQSTENIVVTATFGSGPGTLADAIRKANQSTATSGIINFNLTVSAYDPPINGEIDIVLFEPLPVLESSNWIIYNGAYLNYHDVPSEQNPASLPSYVARVVVSGQNLPGPGLIIAGQNSRCEIPFYDFINFKPTRYAVTNTNDSGPGSLRQMIMNAHTTSSKDTIAFNISGPGPHTINLETSLPLLNKHIIIDGSIQPGYQEGEESIVIYGNARSFPGLTVNSSHIEIYGLTIKNCIAGISSTGGGMFNSNAPRLSNIKIGMKGKGNMLLQNKIGIMMDVYLSDIYISNNFIGTNKHGDAGLGNISSGVSISGTRILISDNVISGNGGHGITCSSLPTLSNNGMNRYLQHSVIRGNKIGTNMSGTAAIPNLSGIHISNPVNVTIGGYSKEDRNVISGNYNNGIDLNLGPGASYYSKGAFYAFIYGNLIGTDSSGVYPLSNGLFGLHNYDNYNVSVYYVGNENKGNVIAYNGEGAILSGATSVIRYNSIFSNGNGILSSNLETPVITSRSSISLSGTAPDGTVVQLFIDNGYNEFAQGKSFIAEVNTFAGQWAYAGVIPDPCSVAAIAIDTVNNKSSVFSMGAVYSLGDDITIWKGDTATIDGHSGFNFYSWSTGQNTRTIKVAEAGLYKVTVSNGCVYSDSINVFVNDRHVLGTDNFYPTSEQDQISICPNPVSALVKVSLKDKSNAPVKIISLSGKTVFSGEIRDGIGTIDVSAFQPDNYFLIIYFNNKKSSHPLVISR